MTWRMDPSALLCDGGHTANHSSSTAKPGRPRCDRRPHPAHRPLVDPAADDRVGLVAWIAYATVRVFMQKDYFVGDVPLPDAVLLAVHLQGLRRRRRRDFGTFLPDVLVDLPYAALTLPFLLLFRLTCYYYRKAYYRAFWLSPPACAVAEPHAKYTGETRFPLLGPEPAPLLLLRRRPDLADQHLRRDHAPFHGRDGGFGFGLGNVDPAGSTSSCCGPTPRRATPAAASSAAGSTTSPSTRCATGSGAGSRSSTASTCSSPGSTLGTLAAHRLLHHGRGRRLVSPTSASSTDVDRRAALHDRDRDALLRRHRHRRRRRRAARGDRGARWQGKRTAIICKSLFGKAHTVMAEGGVAAAMGNVNSKDNWQVHFRDTMRGGKFLNNWRMAELHAKEAPGPGLGARDLRRAVRPHARRQDQPAQLRRPQVPAARPRRRPHRPRADPHPAAEDRLAAAGGLRRDRRLRGQAQGVRRVHRHRPASRTATRSPARFGYWRESGRLRPVRRARRSSWPPAASASRSRSPATRGSTPATATRSRCGPARTLINMEFIQFHPTGMVWPPSVKGILVTESVRGDGGVLHQLRGQAVHVRLHPRRLQGAVRDDRGGGRPLVHRPRQQPAPTRSCCPATRSPARSTPRSRPAAARRTAASSSTSSTPAARRGDHASGCRRCTTSSRSWPTSTSPRSRWRSARPATTSWAASRSTPTPARRRCPACSPPARCSGGMHGSNRLGGNSLSDLLVFGRRAGAGAAAYVDWLGGSGPAVDDADVEAARRRRWRPFERRAAGENPYTLHQELQQTMNDLVGIIRTRGRDRSEALDKLEELKARAERSTRRGPPAVQPGLAPGARPAQHAAGQRVRRQGGARCAQESRGGHTRDDYPR